MVCDINHLRFVTGRGCSRMFTDLVGIQAGWFRVHCSPTSGSLLPPSGFIAPKSVGSGWIPFGEAIVAPIRDLGLRLESQRSQIEILVVDSVERPSGN
jgi:uncharacterized protein (TIGR03435 family)